MPTPTTGRSPVSSRTLFAGAAGCVLTALAALISLPNGGSAPVGATRAAVSTARRADRPRPTAVRTPTPGRPGTSPHPPATPAGTADGPVQRAGVVAGRFTIAWAGHDARPGHDPNYQAAARRAAADTAPELAAALNGQGASPWALQQWHRWVLTQARVTVDITGIRTPDGAPPPTTATVHLRVLFTVTTRPRHGRPSLEQRQVALTVTAGPHGRWLVAALPNA